MRRTFFALCVGGVIGAGQAGAETPGVAVTPVAVTPVALPALPLGLVSLPNGKGLNLSVSPGAGAFRAPGDPPRRIWTITDRGPSVDCSEERDVVSPADKQICAPGKRGKIFLLPGFAPSIYAIDIGDASARFVEMAALKGASGKPLTGIVNPHGGARGENAYAVDGRQLDADPSGIEPGALVRLGDGSFWVAEGYGPSILEVAPDGTVRRRIIPANLGEDLKGADYPVQPTLPAVMSRRHTGRGFDGLALSPDESFLFVSAQGALANPDLEQHRTSPLVRILKVQRISGLVVGQYAYQADAATSFVADQSARPLRQSDVRVVEIAAIGPDKLLVLERMRNVSRIYRVDLAGAPPIPAAAAGEEGASVEAAAPARWPELGVSPASKQLLFSSENAPGLSGKLSGMAILSEREIVLISNNDFGMDGGRTQMFRLTFARPLTN